jgi:RND superfamily putative drug exporter
LLTITLLSFANGLSFMKMFGIGTALAIVIDATVIRGVVVPAFLRVAGDLNWWAPGPLKRLHARIGVSEAPAGAPPVRDDETLRLPQVRTPEPDTIRLPAPPPRRDEDTVRLPPKRAPEPETVRQRAPVVRRDEDTVRLPPAGGPESETVRHRVPRVHRPPR